MYFANEEHERNYIRLLDAKGIEPGDDPEYEAAFYITAHPEIHKCFDWTLCRIEYSPLGELLSPEEDIKGVNPGALTGTTLPLVKAGQSLFNGYKVALSDLPLYNEEFFQVFFQACKIRWHVNL
ncbi:hypothetical protein [Bacillus wiedmannii]|uniref:Uncharacterized protein n=1 Tax=Bacillus wiedmannii TaxID=1890302 RepID=A0A2A8BNF0_9BACI|nr:hypothetical protein [Bacillus wiedmannii]PEM55466.1 hypothetical protein CN611_14445 [Bacillus wiedmannii]PGA92471.1 hypothetical protein COL92_29995 [Bacillus wiedmannii]